MLSDDFIETFAHRERHGDHPLFDSFNGLGFVVYRRTYSRPIYGDDGNYDRHEEWFETVRRVVDGANDIGAGLSSDEAEDLFRLIWGLKAMPGGRMLWQLGTGNVERLGSASLVNCYYTSLSSPDDFRFLFEMLMLGGGVGFNVSEKSVAKLPAVNGGRMSLVEGFDADFIVPDNREGWGELLVRVIESGFGVNGRTSATTYSVDAVRPEGAPIKTFGGVASGPGILVEGVKEIEGVFQRAVARTERWEEDAYLTSVDVLDIANIVGSVVVSGNVRRSAQIALGDATDKDFLAAKRWDLGDIPAYRAMSNNTVFVEDPDDLPDEFWEGYEGNGEAYGMFNLGFARSHGRLFDEDPDWTISGVNPCGEIPLAHRESCNLAELVLPHFDTLGDMKYAARLLYKVQKAVAALPHIDPATDTMTNTNMRLGMGVTGVAQASDFQRLWLSPVYEDLRKFDEEWSLKHGWNTSVRLTTVKPSGTLSLLAGVTPGVHPGYARFHIRRVRIATSDPVFDWCKTQGLPWEFLRDYAGEEDHRTAVVEFPASFPDTTATADDTSAVEQMRAARLLQQLWADNAVSATVTFRPEELDGIKAELRRTWSTTKSISFLPYSAHGFDQAPLEPISETEYLDRLAAIDLRHDVIVGHSDMDDADCEGGVCPVR